MNFSQASYFYKIIKEPVLSEKTTVGFENSGKYAFRVLCGATKLEIAQAIEYIFDVKVEKVRLLRIEAKRKRFRGRWGRRNNICKAYVQIKPGKSIDFGY